MTSDRSVISRNTSVTIGMVIVIIAFVVYDVTWKLETDYALQTIQANLDSQVKNGWNRRQMRLWADSAERINAHLVWRSPSIDVIPTGDDP